MPTIRTAAGGGELTPTEADANMKRQVTAVPGNHSVVTGNNRDTLEYIGSGGESITFPDASTLLASEETGDFQVTIKHGGTGVLTVAFNTGDTVDGVDSDIILSANDCIALKCGSVTDDWMIINKYQPVYGVRAYRTTNQAHNSGSTGSWDPVVYDITTNGYNHGTALNTTTGLVTPPTWAAYFKVNARTAFVANATGDHRSIALATDSSSNGSTIFEYGDRRAPTSAFANVVGISTGWIAKSVIPQFYVMSWQDSTTNLEMEAAFMKLYVQFK